MLQERIEQIARKSLEAKIKQNLISYALKLTPGELYSIYGNSDSNLNWICSHDNAGSNNQRKIIEFLIEKNLPSEIKSYEDNAIAILTSKQEPENKFALQEELNAVTQYMNDEFNKCANSMNDKEKMILELFQKLNQLTVDRGNEVLYIDRIKEQTQIDLNAMADKINSLSERVKMLENLYQEQKGKQYTLNVKSQKAEISLKEIEQALSILRAELKNPKPITNKNIKTNKNEINRGKSFTTKRSAKRGTTSKVRK